MQLHTHAETLISNPQDRFQVSVHPLGYKVIYDTLTEADVYLCPADAGLVDENTSQGELAEYFAD